MKKTFALFLVLSTAMAVSMAQSSNSFIPCNIGSPQDIYITEVGTTWISFTWTSVPNAQSYRVQIFENGVLVDEDFTLLTSYTFSNLIPGTSYSIHVSAGCEEGIFGAPNIVDFINTILVDLVAGFDCGDLSNPFFVQQFTEIEPVTCYANLSVHGNMLAGEYIDNSTGKLIRFVINYIDENDEIEVSQALTSEYEEMLNTRLLSDLFRTPQDAVGYLLISNKVEFGEKVLSKLDLNFDPYNQDILIIKFQPFISNREGYTVKIYEAPQFALRQNWVSSMYSLLPNPTTTTLQIQIPETLQAPVTGTLLNINGKIMMRYGFENGGNIISTADLAPGIYFMRLDAPGYSETFKVVKM